MSSNQRDDDLHELLGAFVLGGLTPQEHRDFTRHLRTCESCQKESAQLSGLPALLDLVDPDALVDALAAGSRVGSSVGPGVGPGVDRPVDPPAGPLPVALLDEVRRRRRRSRWVLAAAAAVLVVGGVAAGVGVSPIVDRLVQTDSSHVVARSSDGSRTTVDIALVPRGWGTQVDLEGSDLPTSGVLYLKVTDLQGQAWDVASWTGTPSGRTTLTTACWVKKGSIRSIEIHTWDGVTVATATI